ncbi:hypothetical protein L6R52_03915 [Myxococcota bacterium]|nr:hypothetical protein [Myxococcota bacterium]
MFKQMGWMWSLGVAAALIGCQGQEPAEVELDFGGYALVEANEGFEFYPPLAPTPVAAGEARVDLLGGLAVHLERTDADGAWVAVADFNPGTRPYLMTKSDRYQVLLEPARYFTDRTSSYRYRVTFFDATIATADVPSQIFSFIDRYPNLVMTVAFRVETPAVDRDLDGIFDVQDHCPDHADPANPIPVPEVCDGLDNDCTGAADDGDVGAGLACSTGEAGVCASGTTYCTAGALTCVRDVGPSDEVCNGLDDDCDGAVDESACGPARARMAASYYATCAVMADGVVKCWGDEGNGRPLDQAGVSNAISIAAGATHFCALIADGTVRCWGSNTHNELGQGHTNAVSGAVTVVGVSNAVQITAGYWHTCALLADATVRCWGSNSAGQSGGIAYADWIAPTTVTNLPEPVVDVSAGGAHACAVLASGAVRCWGNTRNGALGSSWPFATGVPQPVDGLTTAARVFLSPFELHGCALLRDGTARCWGENIYAQLGLGNVVSPQATPIAIPGLTNVVALAAGEDHRCALLADHTVRCWGSDELGQVGNGATTGLVTSPAGVDVSNVAELMAGGRHTCARHLDDTVTCWGSNTNFQLGDRTSVNRPSPTPVWGMPCIRDANGVCLPGCSQTITCTSLGVTSGFVSDGCLGELFCGPATQSQIDVGDNFSCGVRNDGVVRCWGSNNQGQLGDGSASTRRTPVSVSGLTNARSVALGAQHACVTLADGGVRCWGWARNGQLGSNTTTSQWLPQVVGLSNAVSVTAGRENTCARLADNTLWCWGDARNAQLSAGPYPYGATPTRLVGLGEVVYASMGGDYGCAVQSNGLVFCWGYGNGLALGTGATITGLPTQVPGVTNAIAVEASLSGLHTCALTRTGEVYCWGNNANGQVGDGTTTNRPAPVLIGAAPGATSISVGTSQTCVITSGGVVQCWGLNTNGQLGDGTTTQRTAPTTVTLPATTAIGTGLSHTCAKLVDGTVRCWGLNANSQLGDNTTTQRLSPVTAIGF